MTSICRTITDTFSKLPCWNVEEESKEPPKEATDHEEDCCCCTWDTSALRHLAISGTRRPIYTMVSPVTTQPKA